MELNDEITIPAKLELVYKSLNDLEVLKSCIPGCEELIEEEDGKLSAKVILKIGPIKAKFKGKVTLDLSNGPTKYSLTGEGDGGGLELVGQKLVDSPKRMMMSKRARGAGKGDKRFEKQDSTYEHTNKINNKMLEYLMITVKFKRCNLVCL